jgi:hypothetical protein
LAVLSGLLLLWANFRARNPAKPSMSPIISDKIRSGLLRLCVRRRVVPRADRRVASVVCAPWRSSHCSPAGGVTSLSRHREVTKRRRPTVLATPFDDQHQGWLPSRTARHAGAAKLRLSLSLENVGQSSPFLREPDEPLSKTKGIGVPNRAPSGLWPHPLVLSERSERCSCS